MIYLLTYTKDDWSNTIHFNSLDELGKALLSDDYTNYKVTITTINHENS